MSIKFIFFVSCFLILEQQPISNDSRDERNRFEHRFAAMGVEFKVIAYAENRDQFSGAVREVELRTRQIEKCLSDYDPDSEINRLAAGAPHQRPVRTSADLWTICQRSSTLHERTDRAFDPTIAPVSKLWRLARKRNRLPSDKKIQDALSLVGWSKIEFPEEKTIQFTAKGMQLDFGGIAKGFAADQAIEVFAKHSIRCALVDAGGDICVSNPPPSAKGWSIAIDRTGKSKTPMTLVLANQGVASSGDVRQRLVKDGISYSHIIDPRTGYGVRNSCGVTVIANDATRADGLASALSVLGPTSGIDMAKKFAEVYVMFDTDRALDTMSPGFRRFIQNELVADPAAGLGN